jgi:hypothetical protein
VFCVGLDTQWRMKSLVIENILSYEYEKII